MRLREDLQKMQLDQSKEDPPTNLEIGQRIATIFGALIAALALLATTLGFVVAVYSFTYNGEMQSEDAANRANQEHHRFRANLRPSMIEWVYTLRDYPEQINDSNTVNNSVYTQYDSVADHALGTAEWIYRTRVKRKPVEGNPTIEKALSSLGLRTTEKDPGWESSVAWWIWEYRAAIYARDRANEGAEEYSNFGCDDYTPDFVRFMRRTLADRELEEGNIERAVSVWANFCPRGG
jgi:hypothetical protein